MALKKIRTYVYHDETVFSSKEGDLKGHVLFFVPYELELTDNLPLFGESSTKFSPTNLLMKEIQQIRNEYRLKDHKLHFTNLSGKRWYLQDTGRRLFLELTQDALRSKSSRNFKNSLNCKVAIMLYPAKTDLELYGGVGKNEKIVRYEETWLRILLKGAVHYLFDKEVPVVIDKLVTDGVPNHRKFSDDRIISRLRFDDVFGRVPLNENIYLSSNTELIHLSSDHKNHPKNSEGYVHANLLQMADYLLGSIIRSCFFPSVEEIPMPKVGSKTAQRKKDVIASPINAMISKQKRGSSFRYSGHYKSFSISKVDFQDEEVKFENMKSLLVDSKPLSLTLF